MFAELFKKKIIFVSGKGGTGKSILTVLLGLLAAKEGKRVLIAESHAFDKLSPLLAHKPVGHNETQLAPNLSCINLDAKRCFAEYVILHLGMESLYDRVFRSQPVSSLLDAIPGLDETMILGRIFHTCELSTKYDLVIFDSPASGHFINLFATPDAIIKTGLGGPLVREVQRVKDFLSDANKSTAVVVTLPEALVMTETIEFLPIFNKKIPLHLSSVILNRTCSQMGGTFTPAIQNYFDRKSKASQEAIHELKNFFRDKNSSTKLYTLPEFGMIEEPMTLPSQLPFEELELG